MAKLKTGLPKDPNQNGLFAIGRELVRDPLKKHVVVAVVDCSKIETDTESGAMEATVRVLRIERVHPEDTAEAERLVRRALEYRMGGAVLPIEIERDLDDWFDRGFVLDPLTGELTEREGETSE